VIKFLEFKNLPRGRYALSMKILRTREREREREMTPWKMRGSMKPEKDWTARDWKILIALTSVMVVGLVVLAFTAQKVTVIFGIPVVVASIWYSFFTFPITDTIGNEYGKKYAHFAVLVGLGARVMTMLLAYLTVIMPAHESFAEHEETFNFILSSTLRYFFVGSVGFLVAQFIDNEIFAFLKKKTKDRFLWLRNTVSTVISQTVDTVIFVFGMFVGVMAIGEVWTIFWGTLVIKFIIIILDTPLVYGLVALVRRLRNPKQKQETPSELDEVQEI